MDGWEKMFRDEREGLDFFLSEEFSNKERTMSTQEMTLEQAWEQLQQVPSYVSRYARQENRLYDRLKRGETVEVQAMLNGAEFAIQPVAWEGIIMAYSVLVDGKVVEGYAGKMLSNQSVKDWTEDLIERG